MAKILLIKDSMQGNKEVEVEVTEEVYNEYMRGIWREVKRKDNNSRCQVPNKYGKLVRCMEDCKKCPRKRTGEVLSVEKAIEDGFDIPDENNPEEIFMKNLILSELDNIVASLTDEAKELFELCKSGKKDKEIAETLKISKSLMSQNKKALFNFLKHELLEKELF